MFLKSDEVPAQYEDHFSSSHRSTPHMGIIISIFVTIPLGCLAFFFFLYKSARLRNIRMEEEQRAEEEREGRLEIENDATQRWADTSSLLRNMDHRQNI